MKILTTLLLFISSVAAFAQTERKIANTCGETYTAGGIKLRTAVGEPIIGMLSTTSGSLYQGFFQGKPSPIIVPAPTAGFSFFPNPFKEELVIKGDITKAKRLQLYDAVGRVVLNITITGSKLNLKGMSAGVYTARLIDEKNNVIYFKKIVKQ